MVGTNEELSQKIETLVPFLDRTDIIGYTAARNFRLLLNATQEYIKIKDNLVKQYGQEDPNAPGRYYVEPDTETYTQLENELKNIAYIEHNVDIMTIPFSAVSGVLSGNDILNIDWMLVDE